MNNNLQKVKKNKKQNNGFWAFRMKLKYNMERREGHSFENGQIDKIASEQWQKMTKEQKDSYKNETKTFVPHHENIKKTRILYNSQGIEIAKVEADKAAKKEENKSMLEEIEKMICDADELEDLVIYFISTTSFYVTSDDIFPAELAMAKFSLKKGVFDDIQIRIKPGKLPTGSAHDANLRNEKHKYPIDSDCEGENYLTTLETIIDFLNPLEKLPVFFAQGNTRDDIETLRETRRIVEKILYVAQEEDLKKQLKIYPIDELFFRLQKAAVTKKNLLNGTNDQKLLSIATAATNFKTETFHLRTNGCDFHTKKDVSQHCCLTLVRSFGYTISKWCSTGKSYELLEGKHFPLGYKHRQ